MSTRAFILIAAAMTLSLAPAATRAANPPAHEDEATLNRARALFDRALELYSQDRHEEALATVQEAWKLKKYYQIGALLATEELHAKRFADAAQHDAWSLRNYGNEPQEREFVERIYAQAKAQVTTVTLRGVETHATVLVDNEPRDQMYAPDPVFLDVGPHTIEVRRADGTSKKRTVSAGAGKALELDMSPDPIAKPEVANLPALAPSTTTAPSYEMNSQAWSPRTWAVVAEGSLTAVALGVGIGFGLRANSLQNDAQASADSLRGTSRFACSNNAASCTTIASSYSDRDDAARFSTIGFVAGGVLGIATLATLLLWPSSHAAPKTGMLYSVSPTVGSSTGLTLHGAF